MKNRRLPSPFLLAIGAFIGYQLTGIVRNTPFFPKGKSTNSQIHLVAPSPGVSGSASVDSTRENQAAKFPENVSAEVLKLFNEQKIVSALSLAKEEGGMAAAVGLAIDIGSTMTVQDLLHSEDGLEGLDSALVAVMFRQHLNDSWENLDLVQRLESLNLLLARIDHDEVRSTVRKELIPEALSGASPESLVTALGASFEDPALSKEKILEELALIDPKAFINAIDKMGMTHVSEDSPVVKALVGAAYVDAQSASAILGQILAGTTDEELKKQLFQEVIANVANLNVGALYEFKPLMESQDWPLDLTRKCLRRLGEFAPDQAVDWLTSMPPEQRTGLFAELSNPDYIRDSDYLRHPELALAIVQSASAPDVSEWSEAHLGTLFQGLGRSGLTGKELVQFIRNSNFDEQQRKAAIAKVVSGAAEMDSNKALALIDEIEGGLSGIDATVAVESAGRSIMKWSSEVVQEAYDSLPEHLRLGFLSGMSTEALEYPEAVAQLAMQFMDEVESDHERYQDELTKVVASTGSALWGTDETFVYNWLQELPTTELQEAGAEAYLTSRGTSDPVKLSEWLAEWPDGSFRDRMAAYLAKLIPDSPEASLAWTATIDDVDQRRETFMNIIRYNNVGGMMEAIKGDLETFISEEDRAWLRQTQGLSW